MSKTTTKTRQVDTQTVMREKTSVRETTRTTEPSLVNSPSSPNGSSLSSPSSSPSPSNIGRSRSELEAVLRFALFALLVFGGVVLGVIALMQGHDLTINGRHESSHVEFTTTAPDTDASITNVVSD